MAKENAILNEEDILNEELTESFDFDELASLSFFVLQPTNAKPIINTNIIKICPLKILFIISSSQQYW